MKPSARERAHSGGLSWWDDDGEGRCDPEDLRDPPDGEEEVHSDACNVVTMLIEAAVTDALEEAALNVLEYSDLFGPTSHAKMTLTRAADRIRALKGTP